MPRGFFPKKDVAHRLACLSLYRHLLKRCGELLSKPIPDSHPSQSKSSSTLQALVRYRFKNDRSIVGWQHIRNALQFGRDVQQLLDAATAGSSDALEEVTRIISASAAVSVRNSRVLEKTRTENSERRLPKKLEERKKIQKYLADKSNYKRSAEIVPVLQRPVPYEQALKHEDGRRKVPNYFVMQGVPFLRYTRHQPLSLGRFLNEQISKHQQLWDIDAQADEMIGLGNLEDEWDRQLRRDHGLSQQDSSHPTNSPNNDWNDAMRSAKQENEVRIRKLDKSREEWSAKLWEVYLKEKTLADIENTARKEARKREWQAKQKMSEPDDQGKAEQLSSTSKHNVMRKKKGRKSRAERTNSSSIERHSPNDAK